MIYCHQQYECHNLTLIIKSQGSQAIHFLKINLIGFKVLCKEPACTCMSVFFSRVVQLMGAGIPAAGNFCATAQEKWLSGMVACPRSHRSRTKTTNFLIQGYYFFFSSKTVCRPFLSQMYLLKSAQKLVLAGGTRAKLGQDESACMFWPHLQKCFLELPGPANSSQPQTSHSCLIIFHHVKAHVSLEKDWPITCQNFKTL